MQATVADQPLTPAVDLPAFFESAFLDFRRGRLDESEKSCREILRTHPDQAEAWFLLGAIAARSGRWDEAARSYGRAAAVRRAHARYHVALGRALRGAKRPEEAVAPLEQALGLAPRSPAAHLEFALVQLDRGHAGPGLRHYRRAFALMLGALAKGLWLRLLYLTAAPLLGLPRWLTTRRCGLGAAIAFERGRLCAWHGEREKAMGQYRSALRRSPDCVPALAALGRLMFGFEDYIGADEQLCRAVELQPEDPALLTSYATMRYRLGRYDEAAALAEQALARNPRLAKAHLALGFIRVQQNRPEDAIAEFDATLRLDPRIVEALFGRARTLQTLGRLDEAKAALSRALAINPRHADSYRALAFNKQLAADDPGFRRLEALLNDDRLPDRQRSILNLAAAAVLDRDGDPDLAFRHYKLANDLKDVVFGAEACHAEMNAIMQTYDAEFVRRTTGWGNASDLPVLIVGMPRSGTTLVEQIIASHPQAFGAGELEAFGQMVCDLPRTLGSSRSYPGCAEDLDRPAVERLVDRHLSYLRTLSAGSGRITDKAPKNFLHLGLIHCLFPRAPIIHCRRDPMDTCLSIYMKALTFIGHYPFAYNLTNLGDFYREYERLMDYWNDVLPVPILDVRYEDMIADPEAMIRRIVEFCGLTWDDRCLDFHKTERTILTASYDQARRPIYKSSVARWKKYEAQLKPLREALDRDGSLV